MDKIVGVAIFLVAVIAFPVALLIRLIKRPRPDRSGGIDDPGVIPFDMVEGMELKRRER